MARNLCAPQVQSTVPQSSFRGAYPTWEVAPAPPCEASSTLPQVRMSRGALSSCERAVRRRWLRGCTAHARCGQGQRRTAVTGAHWRAAREGRQDHSGRTRNAEATTAISGEGFWVGRRRRDCPHVHVPLILHKRTHLGRSVEPKGTACSHAARTGGQHNYDRLQDVVHSRAGMHL